MQAYPNLLIDELNDDSPSARALTPRDLAFAHAIYDTVVARWLTLRHLIQPLLTQPITDLEARLQAVLLAGAAQLLLLDKVPPYAAINHAVEWSKARIRPGAGAMVNAVLRKVARLRVPEETDARTPYTGARNELPLEDGNCIHLVDELLPADDLERLAIAASVSPDLVVAWGRRHPLHEVRDLVLHSLTPPPIIINTSHQTTPMFPEAAASLVPHDVPGHHVFTGSRGGLIHLLRQRPDVWVQDPASSASLAGISDLPIRNGLIIDACAGQGTKTRQLAAMFPDAAIVATDTDRRRYETLMATFADHPRVQVVSHNKLRDQFLHKADLVVLDVPCSNTGVLARRHEAKYRFSNESLESLVNLQRQIIADAIPLLQDGSTGVRGRILYATCSMEPAENEEQARWTAHWHRFKLERESRQSPRSGPGKVPTSYTDGSYAALLE